MYKLIIVDDEKMILDGIKELFPWNKIGFEVTEGFTNAKKALEYLENESVDVVLTDMYMPDMNGLEFVKQLKEYPDILVVFFSSHSDYNYMRGALKLNCFDYLLKPINYEELSNCFMRVKESLDEKYEVFEEKEHTYYGNIIRQVDVYLEKNFKSARLADIAEEIGISSVYLSKIYKEQKGIGFLEYLNKIRMEKAMEMLNDPNYKSYEIAYYVGYENPKNFTRAFKAYHNITPRDYRKGQPHEM